MEALNSNNGNPQATSTPQPTMAPTPTQTTATPQPTPSVTPIMRSPSPTPVQSAQTNLSIAMGHLTTMGNDGYYIYGNLTTYRTAVIVGILNVTLNYCPSNTTDWTPLATNTLRIALDSAGDVNIYEFDVSSLSGGTYNFKVVFNGDTINNAPYAVTTYSACSAELDNVNIP
jgi:hypothetical protein